MSNNKKFAQISKHQISKISSKRLKNVFNALSRRIFSKVHKNEVEYGQTLSKKRRKNCILKSVSSLPSPEDDNGYLKHSPYHINFQFSKEDVNFRSSVVNFQKIDMGEACCEKCFCSWQKGETFSRFSMSSDSACDVSSESSCEDLECTYRRTTPKPVRRMKNKPSEKSETVKRTLENFIRIHNENFKTQITPADSRIAVAVDVSAENEISEWTEDEPRYESLVAKVEEPNDEEPGYDILVTKPNCRVVEPSYENLKLIQTIYEKPEKATSNQISSEKELNEKGREMVQSNKTYDEVIESLKMWHLNLRNPDCYCCQEKLENEINYYVEGYESLENDFNNDIEEFRC